MTRDASLPRGSADADGPHISVCIATYNGAKWIEPQLRSILDQIGPNDEVIVVDDCSSDDTIAIVLAAEDPRVQVFHNERNMGHVATFERALGLARGRILMLADQDDLWVPDRVRLLSDALAHGSACAIGNFRELDVADRHSPEGPVRSSFDHRAILNIVGLMLGRRAYYGSCMAVSRSALPQILPFPTPTLAHDQWIAICANLNGGVSHIESDVTLRRIHNQNLTQRGGVWQFAFYRAAQACHIAVAVARRVGSR